MLAYFDCFSGISGDMTLGAFIDLGVPVSWLESSISELELKNFSIKATTKSKMGITGKQVSIVTNDDNSSRNYKDIRQLISQSSISDNVKSNSIKIFENLAKAESKIHNCSIDHVHFHEVGGIDAIVDIVGTCFCIEYLNISKIESSSLPLGKGFVSCRHGTLPVPAPATLELLKDIPVYGTQIQNELITPTGASIISSLCQNYGSIPQMVINKIGYGAGIRDNENVPNMLRIIIGDQQKNFFNEEISVLETTIDDMSPEISGFLMEKLFLNGALDVIFMPVYMKKNRPGTIIQVLCKNHHKSKLANIIFSETTSIGLRYQTINRLILKRDYKNINTSFGKISVKEVIYPDGNRRYFPEFEECKKIAQKNNLPLFVIYETIHKEIAGIKKSDEYL